MSATLEAPVHAWSTRPGWGISVDLTPREILNARRMRVHRRLVGVGLVLVAVVCTGVTLMALDDKSVAERSYNDAQARTVELQAEAASFSDITMLSSVASQIQTQAAALMANDLDFVHLLALIRVGLTPSLALTSETVVLAPVAPAPAPAADPAAPDAAAPAAPVAPAGPQVIGLISLAGTGSDISDLAPFIAVLNGLEGVTDVVPTSTTKTETGMAFTLSMNITDELYTRRFDLAGGS